MTVQQAKFIMLPSPCDSRHVHHALYDSLPSTSVSPCSCVEMRPANLLLCRLLLCVVEKQQPCNALLRPSQDNRPLFGLGRYAVALFRLWAFRLGLGLFLRVLSFSDDVTGCGAMGECEWAASAEQAGLSCMWSVLYVAWPETAMAHGDAGVAMQSSLSAP